MPGIRLHWLEVTRYRNVAPGTKLSFGRKLNVVLGRNGAGKSALLGLLAAILTGKFERLAEEPFQIAYCLTAARLTLTVSIKNDPGGEPGWSVGLELAEGVQAIGTVTSVEDEGTLLLHGPEDSHAITVSSPFQGSSLYEVLDEIGDVFELELRGDDLDDEDDNDNDDDLDDLDDDDLDDEGDEDDEADPDEEDDHRATGVTATLRGAWAELEAASENGCRFDEGLGVFQAITGEILEGLGDPDWAYLNLRVKDGRVKSLYASFAPDELRRAIRGRKPEDFEGGELHLSSREVPFLRKAAEALGADEVTLTLPIESEDKDEGEVGLTCRELKLGVVKNGGAPIPHERLSYGEKRLLSFFYYAAAHPDVLLVDDLLHGMTHDGAVAAIDEIGDRQAFVSSLGPLLFAFAPRPGDEERTLIACTAHGTEITWEVLDDETATTILEARSPGVQEVGNVLRFKGLW